MHHTFFRPGLFRVPSLHPPGQTLTPFLQKSFVPLSTLWLGAVHPSLPTSAGAVLCPVRSSFQQVWAAWPEGTTSTVFRANNGINEAQPVRRVQGRHKPAVPLVSH